MNKILVVGIVGESVFMKCDHFHKKGETIKVESIYTEIGGKGFNQALTIKRLGGEVKFVCALGNDLLKDKIINEINKLNVPMTYFVDKNNQSAYATILTNKQGDNQVSVYQGAQLSINDLQSIYKEIDDVDYVLLQLEIPYDVNLEIAKYAKTKNKKIILNPAPIGDIEELLNYCDIITPNEIEVISLFGENYRERLINQNFTTIVTRGSKPTILIQNTIEEFPTEKVIVKDTTGAGDAFNGALVYNLAREKNIKESIKFASSIASNTVQYDYVLPGIIQLKKIEK